jgi:hypothetical protein
VLGGQDLLHAPPQPVGCGLRTERENSHMSSAETPCVFCDIIAERTESGPVYEDSHVIAFIDIWPLNQGTAGGASQL